MKIHFKTRWPFYELGGTREAREGLEAVQANRPHVDALHAELVARGQQNHFADLFRGDLGGGRKAK